MTISAVRRATHNAWEVSVLSNAIRFDVHVPWHTVHHYKRLDQAALAFRQSDGSASVYAVDAYGRHVLINRDELLIAYPAVHG